MEKPFAVKEEDMPLIDKAKQLFDLTDIDQALSRVAEKLNKRLQGESILLINILQGGTLTAASLLVKLNFVTRLDSIYASRYRNQTQGYELEWKAYPANDLRDQVVLLVDDIFDEGITLSRVKHYCLEQGAREVVSVVLLEKQHERKQQVHRPDYVALAVPDQYVFGFGLDYHSHYRNAPGIYAIDI